MQENFKFQIPDEKLTDLKKRLYSVRFPKKYDSDAWLEGTSLQFMERLVEYWRTDFDWRDWESKLNMYPHFVSRIDGLNIHFLHIKSPKPDAIPLLLTHGWPSSVFEYLKIIPMLTDNFHLVIPSLPGHGFSSTKSGIGIFETADLFHKLMTNELGYVTYAAQGGDWGAYLSSRLGFLHPNTLIGIHLSYVTGGIRSSLKIAESDLSVDEKSAIKSQEIWDDAEGGYEHLHSTKPQTISFSLSDSPVGLAAWIVEKWCSWTDCSRDLESKFSLDELLANISWYWLTETGGSSVRLYYETRKSPWKLGANERILTPAAIASFPKELVVYPREWAERIFNVCKWTKMPRGGHFAAAEEPELLAADISDFFLNQKFL